MEGLVFVLFLSCGLVNSDPVERHLICSQQPITALVGDDVILPCHLEPPVSAADWTVEWSKPGLDPESVHYHENGRLRVEEQNPSFSDRTSLSVDDMKTGDVSLRIFSVEKSDSGIYRCFLPSIKKEASIKLIVGKPVLMGSPERLRATVGTDVVLQCHLEPPLDVTNMFVEWRHENKIVHVYRDRKDDPELQDERFRGRTFLFHHEMTRGKISLKLTRVTAEDSGEFTCFIPNLEKGRMTLFFGFTDIIISTVATSAALAFIAMISLYCFMKRARAKAIDRATDRARTEVRVRAEAEAEARDRAIDIVIDIVIDETKAEDEARFTDRLIDRGIDIVMDIAKDEGRATDIVIDRVIDRVMNRVTDRDKAKARVTNRVIDRVWDIIRAKDEAAARAMDKVIDIVTHRVTDTDRVRLKRWRQWQRDYLRGWQKINPEMIALSPVSSDSGEAPPQEAQPLCSPEQPAGGT